MKKILLIVAIIVGVACIVSLLFATLNLYGYYHVLDGSNELYQRLQQRATTFFIIGLILLLISLISLFIRSKL